MLRSGSPLPAAAIVRVQVATGVSTIGRRNAQGIVIADVTQIAGYCCVAVGQREAGRGVIEYARGPGRNRVASCAGRSRRREPGGDVIRHCSAYRCGADKSRLVAPITIRRIERVVVAHMAGRAGGRRRGHMRSGKSEPGYAVIE